MQIVPSPRRRRAAIALGLIVGLALGGCAGGRRVTPRGGPGPEGVRRDLALASDATRIYELMGLVAAGEPFPFVGSVSYLAGPTPDTTLVLVSLSLPNRALAFAREADGYRASYGVRMELRQGATLVRNVEAQPVVRVPTFRETSRGDESVLFQQLLSVAPGQYVLSIALRDAGSAKTAAEEILVPVPRLGAGSVATPLVVYEAEPRTDLDSLPAVVASARSTVTFGRDSTAPVYVEGYGEGTEVPVEARVLGEGDALLWRDTVVLARRGELFSSVVQLPVSRLGVGVTTFVVRRLDTGDSARAPVFVSFGEELPVASFEQMLDYLRYYATRERLKMLADAPADARASAWAAFLRETDPFPATPQHEALSDYFRRLQSATERFREEGIPGWLTDRGKVYISLGDPDQIYEQGGTVDMNQRGRVQMWEYREHGVRLTFVDQTGFGRWRMTAGSESDFEAAVRRLQARR